MPLPQGPGGVFPHPPPGCNPWNPGGARRSSGPDTLKGTPFGITPSFVPPIFKHQIQAIFQLVILRFGLTWALVFQS